MTQSAPFDQIAKTYRRLWDHSDSGVLQRDAVWRHLQPLVRSGDRILDLGCGTGEDAVRLTGLGVSVIGIDASTEMVRIARERGVDARVCHIEQIARIQSKFDGIISIFGPLNCVEDLSALHNALAALTDPGGYLVVCVMGRFCVSETVWYLLHGEFRKAVRRWKGWADSSFGLKIFYPSSRRIAKAFCPAFRLESTAGVGVFVLPSFVRGVSSSLARQLARIDRLVAAWPLFRALGDHRLLIFRRV